MDGRNVAKRANHMFLIAPLIAVFFIAGCGGGGGSPTADSGNAVRVSVSRAPSFPAGSVAASAPAGGGGSASQNMDNVYITVTKVALLPGGGGGQPDPDGETPAQDTGAAETGLKIKTLSVPRTIDLLHLPGADVALFLNSFENVPAGTYGKIRLYYTDPKVCFNGAADNTSVHPTANYHLDVHFVGGNLVIPVSPNPSGGVRIYEVSIRVVLGRDGLKVTVNPNNILIRPQVFADFVPPVVYEVTGTASGVLGGGSFDIDTADGRTFHVVEGGAGWSFRDADTGEEAVVSPAQGRAALDNGSRVVVIGAFDETDTLLARNVTVTLPDRVEGVVVSGTAVTGWLADNTFKARRGAGDNVVVFPMPDRAGAYFENLVEERTPQDNVLRGDYVIVRGTFRDALESGISGFWITIHPPRID